MTIREKVEKRIEDLKKEVDILEDILEAVKLEVSFSSYLDDIYDDPEAYNYEAEEAALMISLLSDDK